MSLQLPCEPTAIDKQLREGWLRCTALCCGSETSLIGKPCYAPLTHVPFASCTCCQPACQQPQFATMSRPPPPAQQRAACEVPRLRHLAVLAHTPGSAAHCRLTGSSACPRSLPGMWTGTGCRSGDQSAGCRPCSPTELTITQGAQQPARLQTAVLDFPSLTAHRHLRTCTSGWQDHPSESPQKGT